MASIAVAYEVAYEVPEPTVQRTIVKIEGALLASGGFALPGKKALRESELAVEIVVVDATEVPTQRPRSAPKKTAPLLQRQKEAPHPKRHTQKAQVVVRKSDKRLLCTAFAPPLHRLCKRKNP